ncbi:hypothetical protein [Bacillus velezensis]|nr:hypothetical protein [Bacillus velezensis]
MKNLIKRVIKDGTAPILLKLGTMVFWTVQNQTVQIVTKKEEVGHDQN